MSGKFPRILDTRFQTESAHWVYNTRAIPVYHSEIPEQGTETHLRISKGTKQVTYKVIKFKMSLNLSTAILGSQKIMPSKCRGEILCNLEFFV